MNRDVDCGPLTGVGGHNRLSVHVFCTGAFIRQQTNAFLEEGKLSRNNSVYPIHFVYRFWPSIPADFIIVNSSSMRHRQPIRKVNFDLVPGALVSDRDMSDLSALVRIAFASFRVNAKSICSGSQWTNRPTTTDVRTIEDG